MEGKYKKVDKMYFMSGKTESEVVRSLDELEQREGELPKHIQLYRQLLRLQIESKSQFTCSSPEWEGDAVTSRLHEGVSLFSLDDLLLDWEQIQSLAQRIADLAAKEFPKTSRAAVHVKNALSHTDLLKEIVGVWYSGASLLPISAKHDINSELLELVVAAAMKPYLTAYAEIWLPKIDQELWRRRYCPICGGVPDLAYLDKEKGSRWLVCSRCDAEWLFLRLECPHCGSQKQETLAYFTDDHGRYRLYVCDQCHRYLKAIDLRQTEDGILLPLERLLTFELDLQARGAGYSPCTEVENN